MEGITLDMADVRPSVGNMIVVGLMACLFILMLKWASAYVPWDSFRKIVNAI